MLAKLPKCPNNLPDQISKLTSINIPGSLVSQPLPKVVSELRKTIGHAPSALCGSTKTPAIFWLAAFQAYPDCDLVCFEETTEQWRDLRTSEVWNVANNNDGRDLEESPGQIEQSGQPQTGLAPIQQPETERSDKAPLAEQKAQTTPDRPDGDIIFNAFRYAAWGLNNVENEREVEKLKDIALQRSRRDPRLIGIVNQAIKRGQKAYTIWGEAETKLQQNGENSAFSEWFEQVQEGQHPSIKKHLTIKLNKWRKWRSDKKAAHQRERQSGGFSKPSLKGPTFAENGAHPNSIPHLAPATHWQIIIDETGSTFDEKADDMNYLDQSIGRVVALVVPEGRNTLPSLARNFHATNQSVKDVDFAAQNILDSEVGVFGFTLNDPGKPKPYSWFSAIHTLLRWVVRQIPFEEGRPKKVDVSIEQRGAFHENTDLGPVAEIIGAEMRDLDPNFFSDFRIKLNIISKENHPHNGYIDAVANTWGGGKYAKERLKQTRWLAHCLLHPRQENLNRILLWLDGHSAPAPGDWLDLMQQLGELPESAFLHRYLRQLGDRVKHNPASWRDLLNEVQEQLRKKTYSLAQLSPAISWLEQHRPDHHHIPKPLRLQWLSARLANSNHMGRMDMPAIEEILESGKLLLEECAPSVAQAWLRVSVAATNVMDFSAAKTVLEPMQDLPDSAIGLSNRGKWWSSQGQIAAFQQRHGEAVAHFDRAIETFGRLSDPDEAAREQLQTKSYRLIATMDDRNQSDSAIQSELESLAKSALGKNDLAAALRSLANRGDETRWLHHLFLRALTVRQALGESYMDDYMERAHDWQSEPNHPWPLINAYRAMWLIQRNQRQQAIDCLETAIETAEAENDAPILHWMASVFRALGVSLGLWPIPSNEQAPMPVAPEQSANLTKARQQLETATTHQERLNALGQCLPFNFH